MPSVTEPQRRLFAIAEHHPEMLYKKNKRLASLPRKTLHEFAATTLGQMRARRMPKNL
jgi:hypothetical protein